jgi:hypothetical protein
VKGKAIVENSYVDATDVAIGSGEREIRADGRFSAGFPRKDGGEEINARIRVANWPVEDLRRAFGILDYNGDGVLSGEFHPYGPYQRPLGFGTMTISKGVAYGEPFDSARPPALRGRGVASRQQIAGEAAGPARLRRWNLPSISTAAPSRWDGQLEKDVGAALGPHRLHRWRQRHLRCTEVTSAPRRDPLAGDERPARRFGVPAT